MASEGLAWTYCAPSAHRSKIPDSASKVSDLTYGIEEISLQQVHRVKGFFDLRASKLFGTLRPTTSVRYV